MKGADATSISIWRDLDDMIPMPFRACRNSIWVDTYLESLKFAILSLEFCHLPSASSFCSSNAFLYVVFKVLPIVLEASNLLYRFLTTFCRWRLSAFSDLKKKSSYICTLRLISAWPLVIQVIFQVLSSLVRCSDLVFIFLIDCSVFQFSRKNILLIYSMWT